MIKRIIPPNLVQIDCMVREIRQHTRHYGIVVQLQNAHAFMQPTSIVNANLANLIDAMCIFMAIIETWFSAFIDNNASAIK